MLLTNVPQQIKLSAVQEKSFQGSQISCASAEKKAIFHWFVLQPHLPAGTQHKVIYGARKLPRCVCACVCERAGERCDWACSSEGGSWNHCFAAVQRKALRSVVLHFGTHVPSTCYLCQPCWVCVLCVETGWETAEEPQIYISFAYKRGAILIIETRFLPGWLKQGRRPRVYLALPSCVHLDPERRVLQPGTTGFHLSLFVPTEEDEGFLVCMCVTLRLNFTSVDI